MKEIIGIKNSQGGIKLKKISNAMHYTSSTPLDILGIALKTACSNKQD
jgi:hypothetical protein